MREGGKLIAPEDHARSATYPLEDLLACLLALLCGERYKLVCIRSAEVGQSSGQVPHDPPSAGPVTAPRRDPETGGIQGAGDLLPRELREFGIVGEEGFAPAGHDRAHNALSPPLADALEDHLHQARLSGFKLRECAEERQQ